MSGLLRAELLKLRGTRAFWVLIAVSLLPAVAIPVIALGVAGADAVDDVDSTFGVLETAHLGALIAIVIGIIASAGEHRRGTASRTFMATPRRWRVVLAKAIVTGLTAAVVGALSIGVAIVITLAWASGLSGAELPDAAGYTKLIVGGVAYWAALALIGVGVGALLQNQVLAIVGAFTLFFVIEPVVFGLAEEQGAYLPGTASAAMYSNFFEGDLSPGVAAVVTAAYCLVLVVGGALLTERRDVT